jgi:hypothetical protein
MRNNTKQTVAALREMTGLLELQKKGKYDLSKFADFYEGELNQETAQLISQMAARGTDELLSYCLVRTREGGYRQAPFNSRTLQIAMRRFVAVAWMLHSEMLTGEDDQPLTLEKLGKIPQLGCSKVTLSLQAQRFADRFGFHARVQKRQSSKGNYATAAKTGWEKRRARAKAEPAITSATSA